MMCVSDLLATGQPSEVKRVRPWGLADRVKGPGISDTSERMQLPLNQALWMDRRKTGPRAGLPPPLPDSPSWEACAASDTDVVQTPRVIASPPEKGCHTACPGSPWGRCWGPRRGEFPVCWQAEGRAYLHGASPPGQYKHTCLADVETEAQPIPHWPLSRRKLGFHPVPWAPRPSPLCAFLSRKNFPSSGPKHFHPPVSPFPIQYFGIPMPLTLP